MKKLINDPLSVVREMLEGIVQLSPGLAMLADETVVLRADVPEHPGQRPLAILSGGGSGHEPAHAGYVGAGMLSAAVAGDVFTSPSVDAVLAAIHAVAGPAGALLVVKNYTGDRLNFGLAAELARRAGIPTEVVVVADDVALKDTVPRDRRRGIAGTVFVHKVAGAAAAAGKPLAEVAELARGVADTVVTMGVGLGSCTVPAAGKPSFTLGEDEIEFGLGIHGEKGVRRGPMASADAITGTILDALLDELRPAPGSEVALLVNGLGGTTAMELAIVARRAIAILKERGLRPGRTWCGQYMTALEMPGCSISLLPLDAERSRWLDAPTGAPAWVQSGRIPAELRTVVGPVHPQPAETTVVEGPVSAAMKRIVAAAANSLVKAEPQLTDLDSRAGDGDLGASMDRAAMAALALPPQSFSDPTRMLAGLGNALRRAIGGSSGPFYATALLRAAQSLAGVASPTPAQWRSAFKAAAASVEELGGAKPGDRTMVDALVPAVSAWDAAGNDVGGWLAAVAAAEAGAAATAQMRPRLGRASYLGDRALGVPDGGAVAVSIWMRAVAAALEGKSSDRSPTFGTPTAHRDES